MIVNPALILIAGGLLTPLFRGIALKIWVLFVPFLGLLQCLGLNDFTGGQLQLFNYTLITFRLDGLSYIFALVFHIAALLNSLYALHLKKPWQHTAGLIYAGAAIGAVFAGDLITLFVYWELTALSSVFLIWARGTARSLDAGIRYLIFQILSGILLLAGILFHVRQTGSISFDSFNISTFSGSLIFLAFGIKCAFPLLHTWLKDAYPEASVTGAVILSAFTTKLAVYALARGFAGTELLIPIGVIMAIFPIFWAILENDFRRVLSYSLNNQLGFMVVAVGVGTEMALNGAAAHAFSHVLYKSLLFMSMGAVMYRTGHVHGSQLGGLKKSMPWTTSFCIIGAASISAVPLFCGFVSKSLILVAIAENHNFAAWLALLFASACSFMYVGIKIPYFTFFAPAKKPLNILKPIPHNMIWAMGITSVLCIGVGVFPRMLFQFLPFQIHYQPYTISHIVEQLQILFWSALAFVLLMRWKLYPVPSAGIMLDADYLYRRIGRIMIDRYYNATEHMIKFLNIILRVWRMNLYHFTHHYFGDSGRFAGKQTIASMAFWVTIFLSLILCFYYWNA